MRSVCILLVTLLWSYVLSEKCITPLGKSGKCISLYDCKELLSISKPPLSQREKKFLEQSTCGYKGRTPKVCCRHIPDLKTKPTITETSQPTQPNQTISSNENSPEDSLPAPRDQCGIEKIPDRIYSGQESEIGEFPWMALLGYKNSSGLVNYMCGGSLINHRYILTAAHCLTGNYSIKFGALVTVRLGEHDRTPGTMKDCKGICSDPPQEIAIASAHGHPEYDTENTNRPHDIGLVRLATRAIYSYFVQPICLVHGEGFSTSGDSVWFSGWGRTLQGMCPSKACSKEAASKEKKQDSKQAPSSPVKLKIKLPIFNKVKCIEKYREGRKVSVIGEKQICAGGQFKQDGCTGDSGGPLMKKTNEGIWEVVGISSYGRGCGLDGYPGIYTSVAHYLAWINSTLQITNNL